MRFFVSSVLNYSKVYCNRKLQVHHLRTMSQTTTSGKAKENANVFEGAVDRFKGIIVESDKEKCDIAELPKKIEDSFKVWRENGNRGIWFNIHLDQSEWVPILAKQGFKFHHAKEDYVMMYYWIPHLEHCHIPQYAHTMIGIGAVVVNDQSQILVVSEKYYNVPHWKLPGGYVEPGENLVDAAIREVWEETDIKTEFDSLLTLRHAHHAMFNCSDLYFVASLKPLTKEIKTCEREISRCQWMDIDEYLTHPHVHDLNRLFVESYLENAKKNVKIDWRHGIHQVLKKPYTVYYITAAKEESPDKC